jgi:MFS family permease
MVNEFGWSRAVVALGMSLGSLSFSLPAPLAGYLTGKFGARANLIVGNLVGALGLAGMFFAHQIWQVYLFYMLAGFGCGIGGVIPATTIANSWFIKKRSLAVGVIMGCGGLGGFIFPLLATSLSTSIGWRMAWVVLAGMLFLGASVIGGIVLARNQPESMGQAPDGIAAVHPSEKKFARSPISAVRKPIQWTLKRVLSQRTVWLIIGFAAASGFVGGVIMGHQIAYLRDLGASPMVAASTLSVIAICSIVGSLGFGALAMKFNIRHLISVWFVVRLVSLIILLTSHNLILIYVHSVLFGISNGAIGTANFTIVGSYYGRENFARIQGVVALGVVLQAAGPAVAGAIYDNSGTYTPAFILSAVVTVIGLVCAFLARPPKSTETIQ